LYQKLKEAIKETRIWDALLSATHFARVKDTVKVDDFENFFMRRAGYMCAPREAGQDLGFVLLMKNDEGRYIVAKENFTCVCIQVKNRVAAYSETALSKLSKDYLNIGLAKSTPFLSLYINVHNIHSKGEFRILKDEEDSSYQVCVIGVDKNIKSEHLNTIADVVESQNLLFPSELDDRAQQLQRQTLAELLLPLYNRDLYSKVEVGDNRSTPEYVGDLAQRYNSAKDMSHVFMGIIETSKVNYVN
jgi:hypothetical protein